MAYSFTKVKVDTQYVFQFSTHFQVLYQNSEGGTLLEVKINRAKRKLLGACG